ncbi:S-layer homology domain-containing protein [Bacillus testis]|uniref:S-layer homology domain-containing protein n=1 Tax=Bacillus testis TaxID=1622072 RepID=UPI00067EC8BD|nr:S-layer homology domain-containing protein [Bacillus testis]
MTYQPKNFKKFVATAATATLVASAVAPLASAASFTDVNDSYKEAVDFVVSKGAQGLTPTKFGVGENIKRVDAAVLLVKVLGLDIEKAPKAGFTDVPDRAVKYVNALKEAGITNGKNPTTFGAQDLITRGELAIWVQKAFELKGTADTKYSDVSDRYESAVAALVANKITNGTSETQFGTTQNAKRGDYAKFLLRAANVTPVEAATVTSVKAENGKVTVALDKEIETADVKDFTLTQAINGKEATTVTATAAKLSDDKKSVVLTVPTVEQADDEQSVVIAAAYKEGKAVSADAYKVEAAAPAVKSVSAINLRQVEVKFNKELDKATAETLANYELKVGNGNAVNPSAAKVTGEKTVVLTFAAQNQSTDATLTVKNVKTVKSEVVADTSKDVRFIDVVAPKADDVEVVAPRVIRVHFSEPLASVPTFKLNDGATAIVSTSWTAGQDYADLTIGIDPTNNSSHTLTISGGTDYAGFKIDEVAKNFVYQTDTSAPKASVSKVVDNNTVEIQFDKEINPSTLTDNLEIFHTVKGGNGYKAESVTSLKNGTSDTIVVDFAGAVFPEGQVKFFLGYKDEKGTLLQDKWGNKLAAQELTASYAADTTAPVLSTVEGKTKRTIEVKFNEELESNTVTAANFVLTDDEDNKVQADVSLGADNKTVTVTSNTDLAGGNYKLTVKDVTDTSNNKISEVSRTFYVNDMVAPTVNPTADLLAGAKKVKVKFSEAMNAASITDKAKYQYNDADLDSAVTVTAVDGNKAVILDFSEVKNFTTASKQSITVGRVADATGNLTEAFSTKVTVSENQSTVAATKAEVTGKRTVKLYFDEVITSAVASDFIVKTGETAHTTNNVVNSIENGKSVLTLTVGTDLPYTATDVTVDSNVDEDYTVKAKNNDGLLVKVNAVQAADKFAPEISSATFTDGTAPTAQDQLILTFSETLYAQSVQDADFTVAGRTIESLAVSDNTVTINLKADNSTSSVKPASVSIVGSVEDAARNATTSQVFDTINVVTSQQN